MVQLCSPKYGGGDAWRRYPYGYCFSKSAESKRAAAAAGDDTLAVGSHQPMQPATSAAAAQCSCMCCGMIGSGSNPNLLLPPLFFFQPMNHNYGEGPVSLQILQPCMLFPSLPQILDGFLRL